MKKGIKELIIFVSGAAVGGSIAAFITYKRAEKKFLKLSDDRVKSLHEYIDELENRLNKTYAKDLNYISEDEEVTVEGLENVSKKADKKDQKVINVPYTKYSQYSQIGTLKCDGEPIIDNYATKSYVDEKFNDIAATMEHPVDSDEDEDPDYIDLEEEEKRRQERLSEAWTEAINMPGHPKIISPEEYGTTGYLDEVLLYYYTEDDTLTDENNNIITDREALIGDAITHFGFNKNSEKVLYVRNSRRSSDYEISKVFDRCPIAEDYI